MKSPFKFLDSYTKDDRDIFFGRDREIEELYQRVFDSKLLLVYGVSGTGKSSLIHCGLANKFRETDWLPLVIRRGGNIMESTASAIKTASITEQQSKFTTPGDFRKGVRSLYLDHYKPVFFIFDQFEELFIFGEKDERRAFIHIVKTLTESDLQCRMIFVMREEYMAGVTEFERFIPTFFANRVRIEKMSHINALEAINEPCKVFNIGLEEGFAETLLEKLSPGSEDVELTYLQVFLDKIFRSAAGLKGGSLPRGVERKGGSASTRESEGSLAFTLELLQKTGNVSDLLGSFLDEQISLMEDPDTAMTVLKAFVSGKGTKRPANEQEAIDNIKSFGKEIPPEKVKELIQSFVRLRVLRDKDDNGRNELRHDALAEKVYEKFSTAEKELLEIRQFIENSYQSYLKRKSLLNNDDLAYISNKDSLLNLNDDIKVFLNASRKFQLAKIRTVRRLTIISACVLVLLLTILGYWILDKIKLSNSNSLSIISNNQQQDPVKSLKLAKNAWSLYRGVAAEEALIESFNRILYYPSKDSVIKAIADKSVIQFEPAPVKIVFACSSKDDRYFYGHGDSLLFIWNNKGKLNSIIKAEHYPVIAIKPSDDGSYIGAVSRDSILTIWSVSGKEVFNRKIYYNNLNTKQIFVFTKNNDIIVTGDCHAVILNSEGGLKQELKKHAGSVNAVDISSDDKFIATASSDKTIDIYYYNTNKKSYENYNSLIWHKASVWSVSFSSGKSYNLISASADSTVKSGNVNNDLFDVLKGDNPFCFAEFTPGNFGYTATDYKKTGSGTINNLYGMNVKNPDPYAIIRNMFAFTNSDVMGFDNFSGFSYLVFSKGDKYFICNDGDRYLLIDNNLSLDYRKAHNFIMLQMKGSSPFFTCDGKKIIIIEGNMLKNYFIDIDTILNSI